MTKTIPFYPRFEKPLRDGIKVWTSRSKKYVEAGEEFEAFGMMFECVAVFPLELCHIANHWREEGCSSKEDFVELWKKIHYRVGYVPEKIYWVHIFKKKDGVE